MWPMCSVGPGADQGNQESLPSFAEVLRTIDTNGDGKIALTEIQNARWKADFKEADLDTDGFLGARDWEKYRGSACRLTLSRLSGWVAAEI